MKAAWAAVMEGVSERLGNHVSLHRIDSIFWQAGQIIGKHEPDQEAACGALVDYFETVGIQSDPVTRLAEELRMNM